MRKLGAGINWRGVAWACAAGTWLGNPVIAQQPGLLPPNPDAAPVEPPNGNGNGSEPATPRAATFEPGLTPITLAECLAMAEAQRPAVRAAKLSLMAAEHGAAALNNLGPLAERLSPDLPVRREQAARGVIVAAADVQKVMAETTQDVIYLYFSYVYARQQEQTAADVVEQMNTFYEVAEGLLKSGVRDPRVKIDPFKLYTLQTTIGEVRQLQRKATTGKKLALEALKQAIGAEPDLLIAPATLELPLMLMGTVTRDQVIADALARRPELAQAAGGVDAFRLEVCAQAKLRYRPQAQTLAAGSDLHARIFPAALRNGEYKPGALAPEMPTNFAGKVADRVARAQTLSERQDVLYDETVNLIRLEAAKAFHTWESATERVLEAKQRFETSRRLVEDSRAAAAARQDADLQVQTEAAAGKAQAEYVEAVYEHIKALAALERITGGAVTVRFPSR